MPNVAEELPKRATIQPADGTEAIEGWRHREVGRPHQRKGLRILVVPVDPVAAINRKPGKE